jgi:hypothetical protein
MPDAPICAITLPGGEAAIEAPALERGDDFPVP